MRQPASCGCGVRGERSPNHMGALTFKPYILTNGSLPRRHEKSPANWTCWTSTSDYIIRSNVTEGCFVPRLLSLSWFFFPVIHFSSPSPSFIAPPLSHSLPFSRPLSVSLSLSHTLSLSLFLAFCGPYHATCVSVSIKRKGLWRASLAANSITMQGAKGQSHTLRFKGQRAC